MRAGDQGLCGALQLQHRQRAACGARALGVAMRRERLGCWAREGCALVAADGDWPLGGCHTPGTSARTGRWEGAEE